MVARLDLSQVFEIYDVREMLEGLCVRLAVKPALLKKTLARALNMLSHRVRFGYPPGNGYQHVWMARLQC